MYNATLNNDFDSYPSQEEYKSMMQKKDKQDMLMLVEWLNLEHHLLRC